MRNPVLALMLCVLMSPAAMAQEYEPPLADEPPPEMTPEATPAPESDTLERGLENFMRNLLDRAEPHLDRLGRDLGDTLGSVAPVLQDIGKLMDDVRHYQAPERLENGDILIRRRADAPPPPPVGDTLRDMLRPPPGDDPRLNPRPDDPGAPQPLPERDPESEIEL
ncbi:hypothetical protein LOS78_05875 [Paracoccus sp. MA]|uniref:hypothetical protein n=1 Tax=Paracoccus sp. MA TaxID=2895796 RepID=UPI001E36E396|nr:hypothetical protein [Paracoccus sp. MA]UFM63693.1 hypothetical protein LOS78_05875 [Paracoccus sp. MA]